MEQDYFITRGMRRVGLAKEFADELHRMIGEVTVLEDFTLAEIAALGHYMPVYEADVGTPVIVEGEAGDFMIILLGGLMDVSRLDRTGQPSRIAVVQQGYTLGEMSMIDGEPRFSSCTVLETARFAVLTRDSLTEVIHTQSGLGAKILVKLVHMLAQRLRNTSMRLVAQAEASHEMRCGNQQ